MPYTGTQADVLELVKQAQRTPLTVREMMLPVREREALLAKRRAATAPALDLSGYSAETLRKMLDAATIAADHAHDAMLAARGL